MPIIRYRTRDLSCLLPGSVRTMRRMARITGRSDDMMIIRGVNVFPTQLEEHMLAIETLSPHYQIELSKQGNMDVMTINVELSTSTGEDTGATSRELAQRVKKFVGVSAEVNVQEPGTIPRSEGKAKRVVDLR
jgi:phenylacetate-CoA ligase